MNEQMNVQIEQYAYIKEKNCVFIYLTFHCYDSKKNHHWLCPSAIRCRR